MLIRLLVSKIPEKLAPTLRIVVAVITVPTEDIVPETEVAV